ncbi:hypothetical protein [Embleya sp. AB8]|uniref:hypothetical protein n=1 Tax=Embleya sp. AB8 TaxID=3156304 RepID=UPI003C73F4FC
MSPYHEDRLPGHERRRRELLAMLGEEGPGRGRALLPGIAAGAVLAVCAAGVLIAQPWQAPERLAAAGPVSGQEPGQGVPRDAAKAGDPVPWDVAEATLATCLASGRRGPDAPPGATRADPRWSRPSGLPSAPSTGGPTSLPGGGDASLPPGTSGTGTPASLPPGTGGSSLPPGTGGTSLPPGAPGTPTAAWWTGTPSTGAASRPPSSSGPSASGDRQVRPMLASGGPGGATPTDRGGVSPGPMLEPDAAYRPYFTAWQDDGRGGLRPLVLAKAARPGLLVCYGAGPAPEFPIPTAADGALAGAFEVRHGPESHPVSEYPAQATLFSSNTWWGRTTGTVARVVLDLSDGTTAGAVVRNGIWFAGVPTNAAAPTPTRIRAYDAAGTVVGERTADDAALRCADAPGTKGCGSRTHWG